MPPWRLLCLWDLYTLGFRGESFGKLSHQEDDTCSLSGTVKSEKVSRRHTEEEQIQAAVGFRPALSRWARETVHYSPTGLRRLFQGSCRVSEGFLQHKPYPPSAA